MIAAVSSAAFAVSTAGAAITTVPSWNGDARTTSASYLFTTSSPTAAPESQSNAYGSPTLQVNPGFLSEEWQDPNGFNTLTRAGHGAWDLGGSGSMSVTVPVASDPSLKAVDMFIHVIWYQGPITEPSYSVQGLAASEPPTVQRELLTPDGAGSWWHTSWAASYDDVAANTMQLNLQAPTNGSVISEVHVYTRYEAVPEPGSFLLAGLSSALLLRRKRRG